MLKIRENTEYTQLPKSVRDSLVQVGKFAVAEFPLIVTVNIQRDLSGN